MPVCTKLGINPGAPSYTYTFHVNDLFDPWAAHSADKASTYTELTNLFNSNIVVGGFLRIQIASSFDQAIFLGTCFTTDSTAPTSVAACGMQQYGTTAVIQSESSGASVIDLKFPFNCRRIVGHHMGEDYQAVAGASPTNYVYFYLVMVSGGNFTGDMVLTLNQRTVFFNSDVEEEE